MLWLVVYGEMFTRHPRDRDRWHPVPDFLAPGIMAQSALFVSIFYGIQIIWERDAGVLTKLMVTPTPRVALVTGKAFAAGIRGLAQAVAILVVAALLGVGVHGQPAAASSAPWWSSSWRRRSSAACRSPSPGWCSSATG